MEKRPHRFRLDPVDRPRWAYDVTYAEHDGQRVAAWVVALDLDDGSWEALGGDVAFSESRSQQDLLGLVVEHQASHGEPWDADTVEAARLMLGLGTLYDGLAIFGPLTEIPV